MELHLDEQKPEGVVNEALEQIAYADRVILNKTDLVCACGGDGGVRRKVASADAFTAPLAPRHRCC